MRFFRSTRRCGIGCLGVVIVSFFSTCITVLAQSPAPSATTAAPATPPSNDRTVSDQERESFRNTMSGKPLPGKGCFAAKFPEPTWEQVECAPAPPYPNPPILPGARTTNVGAGTDYFAEVTGAISSAIGSFDSITGVSDEYGSRGNDLTDVYPNTYSLQLNTNRFSTSTCGGVPGCLGWQQFIFSQSQCYPSACIFTEYWLIGHPSPCPDGWTFYPGSPGITASGCYINTNAKYVLPQTLTNLAKLTLSGTVTAGGVDKVLLSTANGEVDANSQDSILNLAQSWSGAEFNLVGDCCNSEAYFVNAGSELGLRLSVTNGTANAPTCSTSFIGATAEKNNLGLLRSCAPVGGASPAIVFSEGGGGTVPPGITAQAPIASTDPGTPDRCVTVLNRTILGTGPYWPLVIDDCRGSYYQGWKLASDGTIRSTDPLAPDRCITVLNHAIPGTGPYWPLIIDQCRPSGAGYQAWKINGDGTLQSTDTLAPDRCITALNHSIGGTPYWPLIIDQCRPGGAGYQGWRMSGT
jgi:hypothetical protein